MEFPNRIIVAANELMVYSHRKRPLQMHFLYKTLTKKFHLCISNKFVFELQIKFIIQLFEQKVLASKERRATIRRYSIILNYISIQTSSIIFCKVLLIGNTKC